VVNGTVISIKPHEKLEIVIGILIATTWAGELDRLLEPASDLKRLLTSKL